jgi:hypothetical protein
LAPLCVAPRRPYERSKLSNGDEQQENATKL